MKFIFSRCLNFHQVQESVKSDKYFNMKFSFILMCLLLKSVYGDEAYKYLFNGRRPTVGNNMSRFIEHEKEIKFIPPHVIPRNKSIIVNVNSSRQIECKAGYPVRWVVDYSKNSFEGWK